MPLRYISKMTMTSQNHQLDGRCDKGEDGVKRDSSLANWVKMSYFSNLKNNQAALWPDEHITGDRPMPGREPVQERSSAGHTSLSSL